MLSQAQYGSIWRDDELDLIVSDYFAMLNHEIAKQPYVKAHHCKAIMAQLGRSHRSVEFKYQNISAVLDRLGLPWIPGYRPKYNFQNAIIDAIDRYLTGHREALEPEPHPTTMTTTVESLFTPPPQRREDPTEKLPRLRRLIRKFDPVERDFRNRTLGASGEAFVLQVEQQRMLTHGRGDLAGRIRWISRDLGDGAGYDIESFDLGRSDEPLYIEVKTTNGSATTPFFLSRNERAMADENPANWCIYRVHSFAIDPGLFTVNPPLEQHLRLTPESWRASF